MNGKFAPENVVQRYAHANRGVESQPEFERAIALKPWRIGRLTAHNWWLYGVSGGMRIANARTLAEFLKVTIDDLVTDEK